MQDDTPQQRWFTGLSLSVSAGLHLLILALLIFGLPKSLEKPADDQAVDVALVPPPDAPKAEPPAPPPEEAEKPQEKTEEPPPAANQAPAPQSPVPSFNPVAQYGEKDSGPEKSPEGNSATEEPSPAEQQPPDDQAAAEEEAPAADDAETAVSLPDAAAIPAGRPKETAKPQKVAKLKQAKKLFSPAATGDPLATTAMGDLPRSVRGSTLCVSELREQLLRNAPPYFADLLPSSPLETGNVIDVPGVAFRANGQWRDLSYRCEVDSDATKVVSFAFRIGEPIPPGEWQRRGLPSR